MASIDKVAIITGGTRGIGLGIAECLARDGFALVLGYSSNHDRARNAAASVVARYQVNVEVVCGDIAAPATIDELFLRAQVWVSPGRPCTLVYVHNAGLTPVTAAKHLGLQEGPPWDARLYEYFQKVYCQSFRHALEKCRMRGCFKRAVAISSVGCNSCQNPTDFSYEAAGQAKASLEYLVRVYAKQLAKHGATINAVIPGPIKTEAWDSLVEVPPFSWHDVWATGMDLQAFIASTPAQRWAEPKEVGEAVAFLCSERAAFITGVALPVDGGLHLGRL